MIDNILNFLKMEYLRLPIWVYIVAGLTLIIVFFIGLIIGKAKSKKKVKKLLESERKDALNRSRSVIKGQVAEQIAPFLPNFPANSSEVRFIGKPLDFVSFNGMSQGKIEDISFIEVKTGTSELSPIEKSLKEAVRLGKIKYVEYRIN